VSIEGMGTENFIRQIGGLNARTFYSRAFSSRDSKNPFTLTTRESRARKVING